MKNITRSNIYLPMAALILAALAIPAAAQKQVPFKGVFKGNDNVNDTANPPTITTSGGGTGTHLGEFSFTQGTTLNFSPPPSGTGSGHWIAANLDSIDTTFAAYADFSTQSLGYITVTETHTISGGTGRFSGALGSFTMRPWHPVTLKRTSPTAGSRGPLLPRVQLTETGQYSRGEAMPSSGI